MSSDPYRQLQGGVTCFHCQSRLKGDRKAYFRFDSSGARTWACTNPACLHAFFELGTVGSSAGELYELDKDDVRAVDPTQPDVRKRLLK